MRAWSFSGVMAMLSSARIRAAKETASSGLIFVGVTEVAVALAVVVSVLLAVDIDLVVFV